MLLLLFLSTIAHADDWRPLPANVRLPCKGKSSGKELVVLADLDNNGIPDLARLQENKKNHRIRLAVWMNGEKNPVVLDDREALQAGNFLRLELPGTRQILGQALVPVVPAKGARKGKAAPLQSGELKVKFASLSYGACGVNEWVFQWDAAKGKLVPTAVVPR